jgi:hypothetical protein
MVVFLAKKKSWDELPKKCEILGIEHRDILKDRLKSLCMGLSEYAFANLYLFRRKHNYEIRFDDHIAIYGRTYDDHMYVMPLFDISKVTKEYLMHLTQGVDFMFPIHEAHLHLCSQGHLTATYDNNDSDYIHASWKFSAYPGNNLRGKKSLANSFSRNYISEAHPLSEGNQDDAISVLKQWQEQTGQLHESTDYGPCLEALLLREALELFGFIYYAEGRPCGFIIAEELTPEMCVLHFYKGKREFKGIYEYMFQHFAKCYADRYTFFNFEQDLGLPGIQQAKYRPDYMYRKYELKYTITGSMVNIDVGGYMTDCTSTTSSF